MDVNLNKSINQVHQHLISCAHTIVKSLIEDRNFPPDVAGELLLYANQLIKLLPEVSKPAWLKKLLDNFYGKELRPGHTNNCSFKFGSFLLSNMFSIEQPILTPDQVNLDFDIVFDDVREAQRYLWYI